MTLASPQDHTPSCINIGETLARLGDKWSMLVVLLLRDNKLRFGQLKRLIPGISQRVLTSSLRSLERDGLVKRTDHATALPSVDYELTPLGQSLAIPIAALGDWARDHEVAVRTARTEFDAR